MNNKKTILMIVLAVLLLIVAGVVLMLVRSSRETAGLREPSRIAAEEKSETRSMCLRDGWSALGDEEGFGLVKKWYENFPDYGDEISIPGIARDITKDTIVWYKNTFIPDLTIKADDRVFLRISGVTYFCDVWLNGVQLCETHKGGNGVFYPEATEALRPGEENTLVLRVYAPKDTTYGQVNTGLPRIQQPIYLFAAEKMFLSDVYTEMDCSTGDIRIHCTVDNPTDSSATLPLKASVRESGKNMLIQSETKNVTVTPGVSKEEIVLHLDDFVYWSPENPFLYDVSVSLGEESRLITTGFKTLMVDDEGYFNLNGERYYIKCTHTVAQYPGSYDTAKDIEAIWQELLYLKSCGFNTVRFLMNGALEQQLALCDRIGLLVYEESPAAWKVTDSDVTAEQFHELVSAVLMRDRNHASFGIFGMLNETKSGGDTLRSYVAAVNELPAARELAPQTLFLLSSGRWDADKSLGSASNPGTDTWSAFMGQEGSTSGSTQVNDYGFAAGMGDLHLYPIMPYGDTAKLWFDGIGANGRAAFLSEAGAGSQANVIGEYLNLEEKDISHLSFEYNLLKPQVEQITKIFEDYGCDRIYGSAEEMIVDSQRLQASQRALLFDYIRSNPKISGYSLTMSTDTGFTGEGIMTMYGQYKPDMTVTLQEGWADLRWCVLTDEPVYKPGEEMLLKIKLSDIASVLKQGKSYTAHIRIRGDNGTVFTDTVDFIPDTGFVTNVFEKRIPMDFKEGRYTVTVELESGAHPLAGFHEVYVLSSDNTQLDGVICCLNVSRKVEELLSASGAQITSSLDAPVIIVGEKKLETDQLRTLYEKAAGGACVVFLDAKAITAENGVDLRLPFDVAGTYSENRDWLYHKEQLIFDTDFTDGMEEGCLMDPYYYEDTYSSGYLSGLAVPDELSVMVFSSGLTTWSSNGVISGFQLGEYNFYKGTIVLNTLKLSESCGKPVADRMLLNIAGAAIREGKLPAAAGNEAIERIFTKIA